MPMLLECGNRRTADYQHPATNHAPIDVLAKEHGRSQNSENGLKIIRNHDLPGIQPSKDAEENHHRGREIHAAEEELLEFRILVG